MKKLILVVFIILTSCNTNSQNLEETQDYLEYIISSNPPFDGFETEIEFRNSTEKGKRLVYTLNQLDANKKLVNGKTSIVFIEEMKNIILEESMYDYQRKYTLRIGLVKKTEQKSFATAIVNDKFGSENITEVSIVLLHNKELAEKIKKAFIHLGKLNGVTITDLDKF